MPISDWLRSGILAQQLQQQINQVAEEFGAPAFEPHVTLLGGVQRPEAEVLTVAADLAARLKVSPLTCASSLCSDSQPNGTVVHESTDETRRVLRAAVRATVPGRTFWDNIPPVHVHPHTAAAARHACRR